MTIRFHRDAAGAILGLDLTNPAVRNARFPRSGAAPTAPAPAQVQAQPASTDLRVYEGTYALQAPNRVIDLRVWVDAQGQLNGDLAGQQTIFRPTSTAHRFLHATRDDISFQFTVEDGRATAVTMGGQGGREISGPRKP